MTRYDQRTRVLAALLSAVAGYVDASGFMASGGFFMSFMSGNSTRLAVGIATHAADAAAAGALIALFLVGVISGSIAGRRAGRHQRSMVILLVGVALGAAALCATAGFMYPALALTAFAMGAENAVFEADGEVRIGLTYMTGTLVKFGQRLAAGLSGGDARGWSSYLGLWLGLVMGAIAGALAFPMLGLKGLWLPALILAGLAAAVRMFDLERDRAGKV